MKNNPFDVTKAVDYTDDEIFKYWVDMDGQNFMTVMQPGSLVPMMIVGSKGSGKTHIMKYYSYELQKIRCKASDGSVPELMAKERFIGVYIRCSGFNAEKFRGKGVSEDVWSVLYAYFWELWVGERIVNMLIDMIKEGILVDFDEEVFVKGVYSLFVRPVDRDCSLAGLKEYLNALQNDVEYEVQGFLFKGNEMPMVDMKLSMSRLTYGIPTLLKETVPFFKDKYIMYLIDELENFSESQQQLVQTLLREKPMSCSFRVGVRPHGIRTLKTLGGVEENRNGSEFEQVVLDDVLRNYSKYKEYVLAICENRLRHSELDLSEEFKIADLVEQQTSRELVDKVYTKKERQSRAYMLRFEKNLSTLNVLTKRDVAKIVSNLTYEDDRIIERANVVLFYRILKKKRLPNLVADSKAIADSAKKYGKDRDKTTLHAAFLDKFNQDIMDMLIREGREYIAYNGMDRLIELSCGTPRTILNLLKFSFNNQYFNTGETPFENGRKLLVDSQIVGIEKTAEWFFEEHRIPTMNSFNMVDAVYRLGNFLQSLRFSDVPPECSINIFSVIEDSMSDMARENLNYLKKYSYIVESEDRRKKNSDNKTKVYSLNSILLTKWELSLAKRGLVAISEEDAEYIFNPEKKDEYERHFNKELKKYNFPFVQEINPQPSLFDLFDDL